MVEVVGKLGNGFRFQVKGWGHERTAIFDTKAGFYVQMRRGREIEYPYHDVCPRCNAKWTWISKLRMPFVKLPDGWTYTLDDAEGDVCLTGPENIEVGSFTTSVEEWRKMRDIAVEILNVIFEKECTFGLDEKHVGE